MAGGTIAVTAKSGFLFWPAPELSGIARRLMSEVLIVKGDGIVNPRCVLILMRAGIACEGPDVEKDLQGVSYAMPADPGKTNEEGVL